MVEKKKYYSPNEILIRIASYCAYQERCHNEVLEKLASLGMYGNDADEMLLKLITENYVNEERFAKAFAGGKFRVKRWGRIKIKHELKKRGISPYCIELAMKEIDDDAYMKCITQIAQTKLKEIKHSDKLQVKYKTRQYLLSRGFENDLVANCVEELAGR